jgi:hypothetical protein
MFSERFSLFSFPISQSFNVHSIKRPSFLTNIMMGITLAKTMIYFEHGGSATVESILGINAVFILE